VSYDLLLSWVSERGEGTWAEFKSVFDWLFGTSEDPAARAWIAARDLAALGHIDISWGTQMRWSAAPPVVTMLPRSGGRALITGSRTRWLRSRLGQLANELDLYINEVAQKRAPSSLMLCCSSHEDAEAVAAALGIAYTYSVSEQLAAMLPPLNAWLEVSEPRALTLGFEAERLNVSDLFWYYVDDTDQPGLYRCRTFSGHEYALRDPLGGWRQVVREIGVYEVLRWEQKTNELRYDESTGALRMAADAALPPLHGRAATLASGRLPDRWRKDNYEWLRHWNVPRTVAERIAESLGQRLVDIG
jgi:hypothetical protein